MSPSPGCISAVLVCVVASLLVPGSEGRHGRTLRRGQLSQEEMRVVHGLLEHMDTRDRASMELLQPPVSLHPASRASDRCNLGSKSYCPGEVLFK